MGVIVSFISKKCYSLHGMAVKLKSGATITLALRKTLDTVETTSMIVLIVPTLEVYLGDATVISEDLN